MRMKYIFVTGGVVSGLGKGICAASLGRLLKQRGLRVRNQKFDPYFNVDPGTMSPYQHGEVFVTDDGAETDLDLGHYERFVDESLTGNSSVSSGKVYWNVLNRERQGGYLGGTVQIIPHVTDEIKSRIYAMEGDEVDVVISEIGGTVGDIESQPFLEAIRQVSMEQGRKNVLYIHVSLIVQIPGSGELKSKPTQHSVKELLSIGIQPDILVCRTDAPITADIRRKIALFCNVDQDCVIQNATASTLYEVPLMLEREGLATAVCRKLDLPDGPLDLAEWTAMVARIQRARRQVRIALVGKYIQLHDAYLSVVESLFHAGTALDAVVSIKWIDSEELTEENAAAILEDCSGILVPGGFGDRGIEGMIAAARYAREHGVPYFGICLGMQVAVIEFARHAAGWCDANSAEFDGDTAHPVIALMPEQVGVTAKGGTMRLGKYPCVLAACSRAHALYGQLEISERHRHRYEFNNDYREALAAHGLLPVGLSPSGNLVEIVELPDHPWFVGVQFHPEFKSRPNRPHPLFRGFVEAALAEADAQ
ncbi:MAG: CTP synthase [Oscillospiraceae bacterium]|nr:CTP synthase [Oscillospiraceae bacterium]